MTTLRIENLWAEVGGTPILRGIDLEVSSGEVHAVMGPNGSGKSTLGYVIMGRPGYTVTSGTITLDGQDLRDLRPAERAAAGLFLAMQYPTEVPGVAVRDVLEAAATARGDSADAVDAAMVEEAALIGFEESFLGRPLNVDLSGGEQKRNETLQLAVLRPRIAILDELDSGLDVDALRMVSRRIEAATHGDDLGVLAITHYTRLLQELEPDHVHILVQGSIQESGGPELADELEQTGYRRWVPEAESESAVAIETHADPFADPLA